MATDKDPVIKLNDSQSALDQAVEQQNTTSTGQDGQPWTPDLAIYLSTSVLVFTAIALILSSLLLWRKNAAPQFHLKIFGILSIIGMSAFLLVVGYSNAQLTPIVGLFGAIAGYLLGKETSQDAGTKSVSQTGIQQDGP